MATTFTRNTFANHDNLLSPHTATTTCDPDCDTTPNTGIPAPTAPTTAADTDGTAVNDESGCAGDNGTVTVTGTPPVNACVTNTEPRDHVRFDPATDHAPLAFA
jgi:hypothetical protein